MCGHNCGHVFWIIWHIRQALLNFQLNAQTVIMSKRTPNNIIFQNVVHLMGRAKRIWYLSPMRAAKVQASLRIRAVSPEPSLLAHTSSEWRGTFRQKARSLAPLNGWACAVKICHDGMLEDTNSLDAALMTTTFLWLSNLASPLHKKETKSKTQSRSSEPFSKYGDPIICTQGWIALTAQALNICLIN